MPADFSGSHTLGDAKTRPPETQTAPPAQPERQHRPTQAPQQDTADSSPAGAAGLVQLFKDMFAARAHTGPTAKPEPTVFVGAGKLNLDGVEDDRDENGAKKQAPIVSVKPLPWSARKITLIPENPMAQTENETGSEVAP